MKIYHKIATEVLEEKLYKKYIKTEINVETEMNSIYKQVKNTMTKGLNYLQVTAFFKNNMSASKGISRLREEGFYVDIISISASKPQIVISWDYPKYEFPENK